MEHDQEKWRSKDIHGGISPIRRKMISLFGEDPAVINQFRDLGIQEVKWRSMTGNWEDKCLSFGVCML